MQAAGASRDDTVLTFLFSDIEGSTSAWERSPQAMHQALRMHDAIFEEETARHSGSVFKRVGDGFCCAFKLPGDAVATAIAAQRRLASDSWPDGISRLRARIGIHTGTALAESGDYFGPSLNRVARLMSAGHGGQILISSSAAALLRDDAPRGVVLRELGSYRLKDLNEPETIFQAVADGIVSDFPALNTLDSRPNNLPSQISSFVGRESELNELSDLVNAQRLVTIAGPGGIGKTRLLLQLAAEMVGRFKDGVWFVPLAAIRDPSLVSEAIATAIGISEVPHESREQTLLANLASRELLLALDNAEHLLAATSAVVKNILERAPAVRVLTTSREPLHLRGEQVYRLEALPESEGARLFSERAAEATCQLKPAGIDQTLTTAICRQLQGIPLAIELAAARTATLSLEQIRSHLDRQITFLAAPASPEDERHRTLKSTIAWSYELLTPAERKLLGALSVFVDSFTLEAAEALAAGDAADTLDLLTSLADKSFVSVLRLGGPARRYRLLEAIRSYAEGEEPPSEVLSARKKHAGFYLAIAIKGNDALPHEELARWLNLIDADNANIRAALAFSFGSDKHLLGSALCGMWRYWYLRRKLAEGRSWLDRYARAVPATDDNLPAILNHLSAFASLQRDYDEAALVARAALELYEKRNDRAGVLACKNALAVNEYRRGDRVSAEQLYREIAGAGDNGSNRSAVVALRNLATLELLNKNLEDARELLLRCRRGAEDIGDTEQLSTVEGLEGALAFECHQLADAEHHFARALKMTQSLGNDFGAAEVALGLASVRLAQRRPDEARQWVRLSLSISLAVESADLAANALETFAEFQIAAGSWDAALKLFVDSKLIRHAYCHAFSTKLGRGELEKQLRLHFGNEIDSLIEPGASVDWKVAAEGWLTALPQPQSQSSTTI